MDDKLREKVAKIMRLAEKAGTEGEAAAAMERVRFILAKHNLDMSDIEESSDEAGVVEGEVAAEAWSCHIYNSVAELYFCDVYRLKVNNKIRVRVVGEKDNVDVAIGVAQSLIRTCKTLTKEHERRMRGARGAARSFRTGFYMRIGERCEEMIQKAKEGEIRDKHTGDALVVADAYAQQEAKVTEHMQRLNLRVVKSRASRVRSDSYGAGREAAKHQHLGQGAVA